MAGAQFANGQGWAVDGAKTQGEWGIQGTVGSMAMEATTTPDESGDTRAQ